jgi:hypothetical protein
MYKEGDWFIDEGIKKVKNHSYIHFETPFATCYAKEGHIQYLFDAILTQSQIADAKKMREFLEVCDFKYGEETFTGDFIDALIFISHKFKADNGNKKTS